jgi:hypothetical protein
MAKKRTKPKRRYPPEVRPLMYCLGCATLYMRASLREEHRAPATASGKGENLWTCPAGHVLVRLAAASA